MTFHTLDYCNHARHAELDEKKMAAPVEVLLAASFLVLKPVIQLKKS